VVTNDECHESRPIRSHHCHSVPAEILRPRERWADKSAYGAIATKLAGLFNKI
jgi:ATP-dependent phosphoenolpyruvate carboxykinase